MIRVLHITTALDGGAANATIQLHQALLDRGLNSRILYLRPTQKNIPNTVRFGSTKYQGSPKNFIKRLFRKVRHILLGSQLNRNYKEYEKIKNIAIFDIYTFPKTDFKIHDHEEIRNAQIINLHWIANFLDWPSFFRNINKPVVWTFHDRNPLLGGAHLRLDIRRNQSNFLNADQQLRKVKEQAMKKVKHLSIVCPSVSFSQEVKNSGLYRDFDVNHIYNSVDSSVFFPSERVSSQKSLGLAGKKYLVFIGSVAYHKGFDLLLDLARELAFVNFLVVGIAPEELKQIQFPKNVISYGKVKDKTALNTIYSAGSATIITSREENLPNVMLESWACNRPVIAFPVGGLKDEIIDGENGILAKDISFGAMKHAIIDYFENWEEVFLTKRIDIHRFNMEVQADNYKSLYDDILSKQAK